VREHLGEIENHEPPELDLGFDDPRYPTLGPDRRYSAILFIEKEGFRQIFDAVNLCARYDIALASTRGMSVTACRELFERLGVPVLVLHDFDKSGFSILGTLRRNTRRYTFTRAIEVHDLGLRIGICSPEASRSP
jgi:DNA topoisomerase VI subunit A